MQRKFVTNLAFLLVLNLSIKTFWILGIDRTVQNTVGAESYGLYAALFNFSFLFNILLDIGITISNTRNIAQNNQLLNKHLSGIIVLRLVLAVVYFLFSLCIALIIGYKDHLWMLCIIFVNQALISLIMYLRSNIAGLQLFKTDSMISVLDRAIMIMICGFLLWGRTTGTPFQITWFVWAQTVAYLITVIITLAIVVTKAKLKKLTWDKTFFIFILKKSYPFAVLTLLMTFYNRIDFVLIERLLPNGAEQTGIYAMAYRLLDSANMIAFLFSGLLLPMFSHMIKKNQALNDLVELSFSFIIVPAIMVITFCFFFSNEVMKLLYTAHVEDSAKVFQFVMSCFLPMSSGYIFGTLLTANGNLKYLNMVAVCAMTMNITLDLILIPKFQARGAAFSSMTTQYTAAGLQILLAHRVFKFNFQWGLALRYILFISLCLGVFGFLHSLPGQWIYHLIEGSVICLTGSLILFLIKPRELFQLVKNSENE